MGEEKEVEKRKEEVEKASKEGSFIKWFSDLTNKDVAVAGGKGASLGEMYQSKFPVPPGFVVTTHSYRHFIEKAGINDKLKKIIEEVDVDDTAKLTEASVEIRKTIDGAEMPADLKREILEAYDILDVDKQNMSNASSDALSILKNSHEPPFVAVRSSATTEDLGDASFAGQQDSFLNVKGNDELIEKVKRCFSSLFTPRAIYYRKKKGFSYEQAFLAAVVQRMVDSEKSGVMFSKNPLKNDDNVVIEAVFGLGEGIVSGRVSPDHYVVNKDFELVDKKIVDKKVAVVRTSSGKNEVVKLGSEKSKAQVLNGYEIKRLSQLAIELEEHYKKPQDIEFAVEGEKLYIVQSRPITTKAADSDVGEVAGNVLIKGSPASPGVGSGVVKIIKDLAELDKIKQGDILVTTMTNPDMVVSMQKAAGIITDEGGMTSHAAIVSREMGIPAVVGTENATSTLRDGQVVTVDGNTGRIVEGRVEGKKVEIKKVVPTKTKIKVIVDLPDYAKRAAESGVDSVGLTRLEGIIAMGGKHPLYFVKENKMAEYVNLLSDGLKKIAGPFKSVWIRTSDIRSDEYRNLKGAPQEIEGNPMLGDHGIRFSLKNADILESEMKAVKEVADEFSDKEFGIMAPQIISVDELKKLKTIAKEVGLPGNVKLGIMVETPAAVQIINELCEEGMDFISFGTNDLTQYILAIDRNNSEVQDLYDEMNPAVLSALSYVIRRCKRKGIITSICGQAGSKPEMAKFLVKEGIDSISVNADSAFKVSSVVAEIEGNPDTGNLEDKGNEKSVGVSPASGAVDSPMANLDDNSKEEGSKGSSGEDELSGRIQQVIDEEEKILHALDDEYNPGFGVRKNDVPSLNDSVSLSSEDFNSKKEDKTLDL